MPKSLFDLTFRSPAPFLRRAVRSAARVRRAGSPARCPRSRELRPKPRSIRLTSPAKAGLIPASGRTPCLFSGLVQIFSRSKAARSFPPFCPRVKDERLGRRACRPSCRERSGGDCNGLILGRSGDRSQYRCIVYGWGCGGYDAVAPRRRPASAPIRAALDAGRMPATFAVKTRSTARIHETHPVPSSGKHDFALQAASPAGSCIHHACGERRL